MPVSIYATTPRIVTSAHGINRGVIPNLSKPEGESDFYFMQADDPATAVPLIIALVKTRIPKRFGLDAVRDIQMLCPMNRGGVGARSLNLELQAALNPAGERKVERFGWTFAPGDKVMQIENDYDKEVYNGVVSQLDFLGRYFVPAAGPGFFGAGVRASMSPTIHSISRSVSVTPAAIAGDVLTIVWIRQKL